MKYAIVLFVDEGDAPDVVPRSWISESLKVCRYPHVKTEFAKKKLVLASAIPQENWLEYQIKFLKEFSSYDAALDHLSDAENLSQVESWTGHSSLSTRKRKRKIIRLPGESSCSGSEDELLALPTAVSQLSQRYPSPPPPLPSSQSSYINNPQNSPIPSPEPLREPTTSYETPNTSNVNNSSRVNQKLMWDAITGIMTKLEAIENRQIMMMAMLQSNSSNKEDDGSDIFAELPASNLETFTKLNDSLKRVSFKKSLVSITYFLYLLGITCISSYTYFQIISNYLSLKLMTNLFYSSPKFYYVPVGGTGGR
ncbi:unnamed protein product [Phyllotreta striolata]|uniref:Uncharacterized protein n=1 Tax=Phyllotreta striolata TaxID=444603 RepID=A0A9N9TNN9_PHYSR|nr:unnamed protein product [Phyllotreta striolata]